MKDNSSQRPSIRAIYLAAIEQPDEQQSQYLREAVGDDENLRHRVEQMLAANASSKTSPLDGAMATLESDAVNEGSPSGINVDEHPQIGPYKIREQIGEGGMGTVYVAEQKTPVRRKVALKIIRAGMASKEIVARFEAERQALALMDHPNIARVLDGGTTPSGQPFFAMELVQGVPITEYADAHQMSLEEQLEMFVKVCRAVQHAHRKGVIHRDLKPSNILVAEIDDQAVPKVIDFGLAKAISQPLTENTLYTGLSKMMGTPMYMSPEQAGMGVIDVDTRCDVYSLGVLLYELLAGVPPVGRETFKSAGFDEMRRIIREEEPPRPSYRISTLRAEQGSTQCEQSQNWTPQFERKVQGELDWIVMKALEKDRSRRYESASALADDIQRYLHDEPVQACPPSLRYRLGKTSRRYKGLLATSAAIFIALLVGTGVATWQAVLADAAAQQADEERVAAERSMKAAMDAVERLLANVSNPNLANVPGLQETWASILRETADFYERFKVDSGGSPEVDYRAAKVFLQFGHLMTAIKPNSDEVIHHYSRGLELADAIVLQEPNRNDFRELQARLNLGCADYYWMPRTMATEESETKTMKHFQSAQEQYAFLTLADPGNETYQAMHGFVFARMAGFSLWPTLDERRFREFTKRARDLGYTSNMREAQIAKLNGDLKLEAQWLRKAIARYRSDPANYRSNPVKTSIAGVKLSWANQAANVLVDEYPDEAEWLWQEAIRTSYDALKDFPSHRGHRHLFDGASWEYSKFLLRAEGRPQALSKVDSLIQLSPAFSNVRSKVLGTLGNGKARLQGLSESIQKYPTHGEYYFERARILQDGGNLEPALADLDLLLELDKNHRNGYQSRGHVLQQLGEYQRAIDDYTKRLTMRGGVDDYVYKRRAAAYFELGQYTEALADLNRAIDQRPDDSSAIEWITPAKVAACPDREFRTGVLRLADRAVELNEGSARTRARRGSLLAALGHKDRAIEDYEKAVELEPNNALVCNNVAWTIASDSHAGPDMMKRAVAVAEKAVSLDPDSSMFRNTLGVAQYRAVDFDGAIESLEKSEELSDGENIGHNGLFLAMAHARLGDQEEARQWYDKAIEWIDANETDEELQRFQSEAKQLFESLDSAPKPSKR